MLELTYSNLEFQNFPGEDPRTPLFNGRGGKGKGGRRGREGKDREGTEEGRRGEMGGGGSREGTGGALDMGSAAPLETSSGSAPAGGPSGTYILKS